MALYEYLTSDERNFLDAEMKNAGVETEDIADPSGMSKASVNNMIYRDMPLAPTVAAALHERMPGLTFLRKYYAQDAVDREEAWIGVLDDHYNALKQAYLKGDNKKRLEVLQGLDKFVEEI